MNDVATNEADRERQLDRIIADYACRIDAGEQVNRAELLGQYPDLADLLTEHFKDLDAAEAWRQHAQPENAQIDTGAYRTIKSTTPSPASLRIPPSPLTPEQRSGDELFGRYHIERVLGEGAMGSVYLATDTKLKRLVALKIPKSSHEDQDLMQRFLREARAAATLNHRNICQVYDIGDVDDCNYISMAYIEGSTLSAFTKETKEQNPRAVTQLVYKLALAMATAHDKGIVHRDLKPTNIIIDGEQEPVIMDFGLAAMVVSDENTRLTQSGTTLGTPAYMSPEQIDGIPDRIDGRSDMFGLGVIFYKLLCGQLPFQGSTVTAVWSQIATKEPRALSEHRSDLDSELETICLKMLAKDPDDRYADMRELAQALNDYLVSSRSAKQSNVVVTALAKAATRRKQPEFWRTQLPKVALGVVGAMILLTLVFVIRTGEGDLTVTVNDDDLEVVIDDETIEFTNKRWSGRKKARKHRLALKLGGTEIPFDVSKGAFIRDGRQITVKLGNVEMKSDRFEVTRNGQTVITVAFVEKPADFHIDITPTRGPNSPILAESPFDAKQARAHQEAWGEYRSVPVEQTNSIGMKLRLIPPGEFIMGRSMSDGSKRHSHPVRISRPFHIGVSEVTVGQFRKFVDATDYKSEAETDGVGGVTLSPGSTQSTKGPDINWRNWWEGQTEDHPVVNVSWNDAVAFCNWLSEKEGLTYRLPTDAEYGYASRAGTTTRHPFGEQIEDLHAVANLRDKAHTDMFGPDERKGSSGSWDDGFALTAPVEFFPANNFGLHDMPGNVNEWCSDWSGLVFEPTLQTDPQGPATGTRRILRGGNFLEPPSQFASSHRGSFYATSCHCGWGFRVVCELNPGTAEKPAQ